MWDHVFWNVGNASASIALRENAVNSVNMQNVSKAMYIGLL